MAFQLSPGVNVSEIDLTTVVPAVATTEGAIAGVFRWGPTDEPILIGSEIDLVNRFGEPFANTTWSNAETFFTAANFLSYSDALYVVRAVSDDAAKASNTNYEAAYHGAMGNDVTVAWCDESSFGAANNASTLTISASSTTGTITASGNTSAHGLTAGEDAVVLNGTGGNDQVLKIVTITDATEETSNGVFETTSTITFDKKFIGVAAYNTTFQSQWAYADQFDAAPTAGTGGKGYHALVIKGGVVQEKFENMSDTSTDKKYDGSSSFIDNVLESSNWVRAKTAASTATGYAVEVLANGDDGDGEADIAAGKIAIGWDQFKATENIDVSLLLTGYPNQTIQNYVIDNIAESRKDAIAFLSPDVSNTATAQEIVTAVAGTSASSYAVVDSGYKYQYDKYNDVYRWIPLNGDVAGLCARTDDARDPWFSPAGYSRGNVKNVVKLALNPSKSERDLLYKNGINPVITQAGQGTLLFGDKTFLATPSAFDSINVRRLFILLEKAISTASNSTLFEFNDEFTRAQFRNLVEPFLRDVQGRRGIYDFRVVCDETNNTSQIIDSNQFVGDIYIKPARAINFIQLNFVAVRTGVEFSEIVGQ
jgi:hypothetical protein